jgi:hypothetical protein
MLKKSLLSGASLAVFLGSASLVHATAVYQDIYNTTPGHAALKLIQSVSGDPLAGKSLQGAGDYYNTGSSSSFTLTDLSFYGGSSAAGVGANIDFYDTSGNFVATVVATSSEIDTSNSLITLNPSDVGFGSTLPGSGYFIFAPFDSAGTTASLTLGYSDAVPAVGSSSVNQEASDDTGALYTVTPGEFSPYSYAKGLVSSAGYAAVELDTTSVPEPASLSILTGGGLLLLRRRRTA